MYLTISLAFDPHVSQNLIKMHVGMKMGRQNIIKTDMSKLLRDRRFEVTKFTQKRINHNISKFAREQRKCLNFTINFTFFVTVAQQLLQYL